MNRLSLQASGLETPTLNHTDYFALTSPSLNPSRLVKYAEIGYNTLIMEPNKIKSLAVWGSATVLVFGSLALLAIYGNGKPAEATPLLANAITAIDWVNGGSSAKVELVEYSDFQCPACGYYYPWVKQLQQKFGDQIKFAYRYFPLSSLHKNAQISAQAAEAAGQQGKFWEMHDKLFDNQAVWSDSDNAANIFSGYAKDLGLNITKFSADLNSDKTIARVGDDYQSGVAIGINHTPTFFLNGTEIQNPNSYANFEELISKAIAAAK